MKAFVTGATGLLGGSVVRELLAQGHEVTGLVRSAEKARKLFGDAPVRWISGDMADVSGFAPALSGMDVVFHTAAYFRETYGPGNHDAMLQRINVDGTIRLLEACDKAGVGKVIIVGSTSVIGVKPDGSAGDESSEPDEHTFANAYATSKVRTEQAIHQFLKTHTLPVIFVLPSGLYGPYDAAPTPSGQFVIDFISGKMPMIPPGSFSVVDARDVAKAMITAAERGRNGERYILNNRLISVKELMELIAKASGTPMPRMALSDGVATAIANVSEGISKLTGKPAMMPRAAIRLLIARRDVDSSKAMRELGFTNRPFETTIADTVRWFEQNGYLKRG